jgi:hypothetical protein
LKEEHCVGRTVDPDKAIDYFGVDAGPEHARLPMVRGRAGANSWLWKYVVMAKIDKKYDIFMLAAQAENNRHVLGLGQGLAQTRELEQKPAVISVGNGCGEQLAGLATERERKGVDGGEEVKQQPLAGWSLDRCQDGDVDR